MSSVAKRRSKRRPLDREGTAVVPDSSDAHGVAALAALTMMRQAPSLLLPASLTAPASFSLVKGDDKSLSLARSLVQLGLGSLSSWDQHKGSCSLFVRSALNSWLKELGADRLKDHIDLDLAIIENADAVDGLDAREGRLFILVQVEDGCGCLMVGQALDTLEAESAGLGRAFYEVLSQTMMRWMNVYDMEAARDFSERWKESIEMDMEPEDGKVSSSSFEEYCDAYNISIPNVEEAIPPCLRRPAIPKSLGSSVKVLCEHRHGSYADWIGPVLTMAALRVPLRSTCKEDMGCWDDAPLPNWLLHFSHHDPIAQAFDEECQTMHECSHSPTWIDSFDPANVSEVKRVLLHVRALVHVNLQIVQLSTSLRRSGTHGSTDQHRLDDELRAA